MHSQSIHNYSKVIQESYIHKKFPFRSQAKENQKSVKNKFLLTIG